MRRHHAPILALRLDGHRHDDVFQDRFPPIRTLGDGQTELPHLAGSQRLREREGGVD